MGSFTELKGLSSAVDPAVDPRLAKYAEKTTEDSSDARVGNLYRRTVAGVRSTAITDALRQIEAEGYSPAQAEQILEAADRINAGQRLTAKQQALWEQVENNPNVMDAASVLVGIDDNTRKRGMVFVGEDREQEEGKDPYTLLRESVNPQTVGDVTTPQPAAQAAPLTRGAMNGAEQSAANRQAENAEQQGYALRNDNAIQNGGMNDANAQYAAAQGAADGGSVLYGGGQRNDGASAGQPVGSLGSRAGQDSAGRAQRAERIREEARRRNIVSNLRTEPVSSKSQGIQAGTDSATMRIVPEESWTEGMTAKARQIYEETGKSVTYVAGPIEIVGRDGSVRKVRGVNTESGIFVRLDHSTSAEAIADHESFHGMLDAYGADIGRDTILDAILEKIRESFTQEQLQAVLDRYNDALCGLYEGSNEAADSRFVLEELLADAYAGINAFGAGATKFSEAVQGFMRDNHMSREVTQDNGTEQPTGPPAEGRTLQQEIEAQWGAENVQQKENTAETGGERYSLMEFEEDGRRFVEIDQDQDRFAGKDPSEYPRIAKDIINDKFNGRVIGDDQRMFVNGAGRDEFVNPSKPLSQEMHEVKMRAAGELDNLLDAGINFRNRPDGADGHIHKDVIGGFDYFDTLFKIGNRWFEATINIKNVNRGKLFKDVTQIKEVTQAIMSSYGSNPKSQFLRTSSMSSIRAWIEKVNKKIQILLDKVSTNHAAQMEKYTELKDSDPAQAQSYHDSLMAGPYAAEFGEYLQLTEQLDKLEAQKSNAKAETAERASVDDPEVDVKTIEKELNSAGLILTSKDKNKNNQRVRAYLNEHYPNIGDVKFENDKSAGYVTVKQIVSQNDVESRRVRDAERMGRQMKVENFRKKYLTPLGILDLVDAVKRRVEKTGIDASVHRSRSSVGSLSFYIETDDGQTIKLSDHNTVGQKMAHPDSYFVDLTDKVSVDEVWDSVMNARAKYTAGEKKQPLYSVDDTDVAAEAKEQLLEALRGIAPQQSMDGRVRQLIDQYTTELPVKPQAPKLKVDRGNLRRALSSTMGLSEEEKKLLSQALDEYTEAVKPKKPVKKTVELDVESKPTEAKKQLQKKLLDIFSIPEGQKGKLRSYIGSWADRIVKNGALTEADRKAFFTRMYEAGAMTVPADTYAAETREYMKGGRIYMDDTTVAELGDDWADLRRRAFSAGIYLTRQRETGGKPNMGVDVWNGELAGQLPWLFDAEATDRKLMLEQIVRVAEDGRDEKLSLAEYTKLISEQEFVSEDEILDNLERQMEWALKTFAEAAEIEIQLKDRNLRQRLKEQADNKEARDKRKAANELREQQQRTLKTLQWLNRNRNRAPEELREAWDEVLGDIDLYAVGAANEMNWSEKHNATWKNLAQMYKDAKSSMPVACCCHQFKNWWLPLFSFAPAKENANRIHHHRRVNNIFPKLYFLKHGQQLFYLLPPAPLAYFCCLCYNVIEFVHLHHH